MNKSDSQVVENVIHCLSTGQTTEALETLIKGRKRYPCKIAVLSCLVTSKLIESNDQQSLKFFIAKLELYHTNRLNW